MIWPFLIGAAILMALISFAFGYERPAKALVLIAAAILAIRIKSEIFVDTPLSMPLGALIWATCGVTLYRVLFTISGSLIALIPLTSLWAHVANIQPVVGAVPFVIADLLIMAAILRIGRHGTIDLFDAISDMAFGGSGNRTDSSSFHLQGFQGAPQEAVGLK